MKKIILLMVGLVSLMFGSFVEGNRIGVPLKSPTQSNPIIFLNTVTGVGATWNQWTTVDMTGKVPADTKAIRLDGILIISHGSSSETADLMVHFRKTNDTSFPYTYIMQTIETDIGAGQRSNAGTWVALDENLTFQYKWNVNQLGTYPQYSSYGINLSMTAYLRDVPYSSTETTSGSTSTEDARFTDLLNHIKSNY